MLKEFVGTRTSGFLFVNRNGKFLAQNNLLRCTLHRALQRQGQPKGGFHAFRRYRTTWLRTNWAPEDLIYFWLGHADETVTAGYSRLREDVEYRRKIAEEVGLGFQISDQNPLLNPDVPKDAVVVIRQNVA